MPNDTQNTQGTPLRNEGGQAAMSAQEVMDRLRLHTERVREWTQDAIAAIKADDKTRALELLTYTSEQAGLLGGRLEKLGAKRPECRTNAPITPLQPYDSPVARQYAQALAYAHEWAQHLDRERYGPDCAPDGPNAAMVEILFLIADMEIHPPTSLPTPDTAPDA